MPELLCPHCLQPLDNGYHGECVHCGRSLENRNPEGALPLGTQLGGKYTVGAYLSADGDGLSYRGVLNAEKRFVLIKEYFPVTLCNGRSASGALMPKEEKEVLFKTSRMDFKDLYDDLHNLTPATGLSTILDVMEENNTVYAVEENEKGMTLSHYLHLRSRTLTPAEARTLLQPIMEGVALLHTSGLIHRGICPDNILLPIDGTARLTGYGTLALRTGGKASCTRATPRRSNTPPPSSAAAIPMFTLWRQSATGWSRGRRRWLRPSAGCGTVWSLPIVWRQASPHGSRRYWPAPCGWTPPSGCRRCPS